MDGVAYLIHKSHTRDELGQLVPKEEKIEVFVMTKSVSGKEWHEAGRNGLKADIALITAYVNYSGETFIEYDGVRYGIYRTYHNKETDEIELYLEKKAGE